MRALMLEKQAPISSSSLHLKEVNDPLPDIGQIRISVIACGICHTDLHEIEGDLAAVKLPIVPGHQVIGKVEALGQSAKRWKVGERVGVPWLFQTCGICKYCRSERENLCQLAKFTGYHVNGGFADFLTVAEDYAYPISPEISDENAAPLLCAGVIGFRSLSLSEIKPGGRLGLYGFGASAHICLQIARYWGCEVYVFTRSAAHRQLALRMGANWAGGVEDDPGAKMDSSITYAPIGGIVLEALRGLERGGILAINAVHMTPIPELAYQDIYYERTIRSVANSTRKDAIGLLKLAAEIPIHTEVEIFDFTEANRALMLLKESKINGAAVLHITGS